MFVGIDNSTTSLNIGVVGSDGERTEAFAIDRTELFDDSDSFLDLLGRRIDVDAIDLAAMGYHWGNGISAITDVDDVENRGIKDTIGYGEAEVDRAVYDEIRESDVPAVLLPAVHDDLPCLHEYFTHYTPLSGPDHVATVRYAQQVVGRNVDGDAEAATFICANTSSSSIATVVIDGTLRGSFYWIGLGHGWLDLPILRGLVEGEIDPKDAYMEAGLMYKPGSGRSDLSVPEGWGEKFENPEWQVIQKDLREVRNDPEVLELMYLSTLHNVYSLVPFVRYDAGTSLDHVVVSGRLARVESPVDVRRRIRTSLSDLAPTTVTEPFSCAHGAALIARDVHDGASEILGIPVSY